MEIPLEQLESLFSEPGYMYYGHGTGRMGDSDEIINSIFTQGLRTKDNSLYFTTMGLSAPTPELKEQCAELDLPEPTLEGLKEQFNNWQHQDSKRIVILRFPMEYINQYGDSCDRDGEMFGAFYNEETQANGKTTYYVDPRFILGYFDVNRQVVRINDGFEKDLSDDALTKTISQYKEALEKTRKRIESFTLFEPQPAQPSEVTSDLPNYDDIGPSDWEWDDAPTSNMGR